MYNFDPDNKLPGLIIGLAIGIFACGMVSCGCCAALGFFIYKQCTKPKDDVNNDYAFDVIVHHTPMIFTETSTGPTLVTETVTIGDTEDIAIS